MDGRATMVMLVSMIASSYVQFQYTLSVMFLSGTNSLMQLIDRHTTANTHNCFSAYPCLYFVTTRLTWNHMFLIFKFFFFKENHYALVCQANWFNMTFTAGNVFPSHLSIGWPESHWDSNLGPQIERWTTYQLSCPSPLHHIIFIHSK